MDLPASLSLVIGSLCADEAPRYAFKVGGVRRDSETWRTRLGWGEDTISTLPGLTHAARPRGQTFLPCDRIRNQPVGHAAITDEVCWPR